MVRRSPRGRDEAATWQPLGRERPKPEGSPMQSRWPTGDRQCWPAYGRTGARRRASGRAVSPSSPPLPTIRAALHNRMPAVLLNPELASLARRGVRRLNRTQGFACAVSLGRDDMLAGQRAGGQCEERRPEPDRTDCRLDLLGSNNVPADRSSGTQAAVRLNRLVVEFKLRETEGDALGRTISA